MRVSSQVANPAGYDTSTVRCPPDDPTCNWRMIFYVQSGVLSLFTVASFFVPSELFDLGVKAQREAESPEGGESPPRGGAAPAAAA